MRDQEVRCFARAIPCSPDQISVVDLINGHRGVANLSRAQLDRVDAVLIGGSGDYSVAHGGPWLPAALEVMADLAAIKKPTFASCWGFQAMAKALGGEVIHNPANAELGTLPVTLTTEGETDEVFGQLGDSTGDGPTTFEAIMGHEDHVIRLPSNAVRLAYSDRVENQAFRLAELPIYATQFHPELDTESLIQRLEAYSRYVSSFAGKPLDEFRRDLAPTPIAGNLLPIFVGTVFN